MAGTIINNSSHAIWITADGKKHCLAAGEDSSTVGISDADGLLLDGRRVLFDSTRTDLGGGQINSDGAIKVCDLGTMTLSNGLGPAYDLKAEIDTAGFICPSEPAGYKNRQWCTQHSGWDINTVQVGRQCP